MVSLALRFRPLFWMDVLVPQLGTAPAVKSGETGFGRCFGLHQSGKLGLLTIDGNPASANFLEVGKHGSSTLRTQISLKGIRASWGQGMPPSFKSGVALSSGQCPAAISPHMSALRLERARSLRHSAPVWPLGGNWRLVTEARPRQYTHI